MVNLPPKEEPQPSVTANHTAHTDPKRQRKKEQTLSAITNPTSDVFRGLPPEIILQICKHFGRADRMELAMTCKITLGFMRNWILFGLEVGDYLFNSEWGRYLRVERVTQKMVQVYPVSSSKGTSAYQKSMLQYRITPYVSECKRYLVPTAAKIGKGKTFVEEEREGHDLCQKWPYFGSVCQLWKRSKANAACVQMLAGQVAKKII